MCPQTHTQGFSMFQLNKHLESKNMRGQRIQKNLLTTVDYCMFIYVAPEIRFLVHHLNVVFLAAFNVNSFRCN